MGNMLVQFILLFSLSFGFSSVESHDICNFTLKVQRNLEWMGFHRNLSFNITFVNHSFGKKDKPVFYYHECILAIQQLLPAGIYVDPDELEDLRRNKKLSAYPQSGLSVEAAAPFARPFYTYIFVPVYYYKVATFLPVHARYQSPAEGAGMANNVIENPSAFLRCPDDRLEECDMQTKSNAFLCEKEALSHSRCPWKQVAVKMPKKAITWAVPIGNLNHYTIVEVVTLGTVVFGCMRLITTMLEIGVPNKRRWCRI